MQISLSKKSKRKFEFTIIFIVEAEDIPSAIKQVHPMWERGQYTLMGVMEKEDE